MHRGCFVWTPTPPLSGQRTPRPGPACVCLYVPCLAGSGGPASRARSGAPHLPLRRSWFALCLFGPHRAGVALFVVVVGFLFFFPFPLPPPRCTIVVSCLRVFRPRVPWALASCPPPPFFLAPHPPLVVSGVSCSPVAGGLCAPPPLFFSFVSCFSFFRSFSFFFCRLCGAGRVCVSLAVGCARMCLSGAAPVVAHRALAGVGWCSLLGLVVLCCPLVGLGVVLRWCCPCLAVWLAALLLGVVCLGVPLPCVVFCCAVLSCGGVLSCSAVSLRRCLRPLFVSCRCASAVCVLGCLAVCSLSSLRCAGPLFVVLRASSVLFLVAGVVGSWCRCLSLGVCWWLWLPGVVVWWCVSAWVPVSGLALAQRLPCGVLLPCAVSCGALLPCGAVLWCVVFFFLFFFLCSWRWFPVVPRWFWAPGRFWVISDSVHCPCGAVLVCLRRCSLFGALLPSRGWLVFCLFACCVCVFAVGPGCPLLSPGGSCWLLVSCLGGVLWRVPGCCAAPCCCVLCRLALRCCALCCFVLLGLVLPRAVLCLGALSVVLGYCSFWRRVLSCPLALCVFCCGVSLRGVVRRCALCRVRPGVSCCAFPVVSALCGVAVWPALPRCPAPLCCARWCCAAAWCRGVLS